MTTTFKQLTDFFLSVGADQVRHTEKSYLAHAIGVYRDLKAWGCGEEVCRAGMFHSIYGTQKFQLFTLPSERRPELQALIGQRAEWLAYVNCFMDRPSFDHVAQQAAGPYQVLHRLSGDVIALTPEDFEDLCRIHLCDWLEQVPRSQEWNYRREAYEQLSRRLGGVARQAFERVYAQLPVTPI